MSYFSEAYLDIETTGLSFSEDYITVIGIYLCNGKEEKLTQLVGEEITRENLLNTLGRVSTIYTYNGRRFDLPFIKTVLEVDLEDSFRHHDLMYRCWEHNLKGGFKAVEVQLGISRETAGIGGYDAVLLWRQYLEYKDEEALGLLLKYNSEDVVNLKALREKLESRQDGCQA